MKLTIGHLYPDLLNLYGDRGNIQCMKKRCEWRGIEAEVREFQITDAVDFTKLIWCCSAEAPTGSRCLSVRN